MNRSILIGLSQVAEIYGREPLSLDVTPLYRRATGIDDDQFLERESGRAISCEEVSHG